MKTQVTSPHLERVCEYISTHCAERLYVDELSKVAGISVVHLNQLFRKDFQMTPKKYVWQYRLERAANLLNETGWSVSEVGSRLGFQSVFHFSRLFKQAYQLSPREFRRAAWKTPSG